MNDFAGKRVTVMGLGRFGGGVEVARWLVGQGAKVIVTDLQPAGALADSVEKLDGFDIAFKLGGHDAADFRETDLVVASPAVPPGSDMLKVAHGAGVPITTEIRLLVERLPTRLTFGVTGTKGKSTTAYLLAKMLAGWRPIEPERAERVRGRRAVRSGRVDLAFDGERRVWLGGNYGGSLLSDLEHIRETDFVVLELSSYMLHHLGGAKWSPHVAVVTMVGEDHLAWHGSAEAYLEAKQNIVRFQSGDDYAVLPTFSKAGRAFKERTAATIVEYGKRAHLPEAFAPQLLGKHNRLNERAAYAAAALAGVYPEQAAFEVMDFAGLPHRLELVWEDERGVRWVNDSIATIPAAAVAACEAFEAGKVIQIVGGSDKGNDLTPMRDLLPRRCKAVLTIGAMGRQIEGEYVGDLASAVARAREIAEPGDVVLLSPGFASYDQFANFEERGELFTTEARRPQSPEPEA